MTAREEELTKFTSFDGLNNQSKEHAVKPNTLREGVDVDLTRELKIQTRPGYGLVLPTTLGHSLWGNDALPFGLFADGVGLYAFHEDESSDLLRDGLSAALDISYSLVNDSVYWSNGIESGMVTLNLEPIEWACPNPDGQPDLAASNNGDLGGGIVQVAITFVDRLGRESGSTRATSIELQPNQGVMITNIPQPADPLDVPRIRIYATTGNGKVLYLANAIGAGTTSYLLLSKPEKNPIRTQFLRQMPAGHIVRHWNARQLVARNRFVLWSPPLRYGMTHIGHMHTGFPERVTLMEPVGEGTGEAGVYVASGNRTYFLRGGDPAKWAQSVAYGYGCVEGSARITPAKIWGIESEALVPAWLARSGLYCVGMPGGNITTFKHGEGLAGVGERGASLLREADGLSQFITTVRGATQPRAVVGDTAIARVYDELGNLKP